MLEQNIFCSFAEFERGVIQERVKLENLAKQQKVKTGKDT